MIGNLKLIVFKSGHFFMKGRFGGVRLARMLDLSKMAEVKIFCVR